MSDLTSGAPKEEPPRTDPTDRLLSPLETTQETLAFARSGRTGRGRHRLGFNWLNFRRGA
jgi:hypothetical protein